MTGMMVVEGKTWFKVEGMSVSLMGKYHPWIERGYTVRLRINRESRKVGGRDIKERRQIGKAS